MAKTFKLLFLAISLVFIFANSYNFSQAAPSLCTSVGLDGSQENCTHEGEESILAGECMQITGSAIACNNMNSYLSFLEAKCSMSGQSEYNCSLISADGYYGNEASRFANSMPIVGMDDENAMSGANDPGAGGLDFDSLDQFNLPDNEAGVKGILVNLVKWMFEIIAVITLIAFVISGGQYLLASGDEKMIETAKRNMTYSIIGIIVALSGFVILRAVDTALQGVNPLF
jgi:hypothetical protein